MILECADRTFGCVASMDMRMRQLEGAVVGCNCSLIRQADFIVEDVQGGGCATHCESLVDVLVGCNSVRVVF